MEDVSKSTVCSNIWRDFFDTLESNVTSITLSDNSTVTIQTYTNSYPDKTATSESSYPIIVINSPEVKWTDFTFGKTWVEGTILIEIFSTGTQSAERFLDAINNCIEGNKDDLRDYGISRVNLESTGTDTFFRGEVKVHVRSASFSFKYSFDKTRSW